MNSKRFWHNFIMNELYVPKRFGTVMSQRVLAYNNNIESIESNYSELLKLRIMVID